MRPRRNARLGGALLSYAVLVLATLGALFPVYWTLLTSFRQRVEIFAVPPRLVGGPITLENYREVLGDDSFLSSLGVTILVTAVATVLSVAIGTLAAYGLARHPRFRGRGGFDMSLFVVRAMPAIVLAVPLYQVTVRLDVYDNPWAMSVVYAALNLPFAVWLMIGFISGVPVELEESAQMDGAGQFRILTRIVLPLVGPGMAATTIFVALLCWNEFLVPLVLADETAKTLPVYVAGFVTARTIEWGGMAAAASLAIIPIAALTILVQRQLVAGLSLGAVKE
jgi:ABC-type glycerol-3-phosphate transport system permease component